MIVVQKNPTTRPASSYKGLLAQVTVITILKLWQPEFFNSSTINGADGDIISNSTDIPTYVDFPESIQHISSKYSHNAAYGKVNSSFTDTANHWANASISWFAKYGLVKGYKDGSFKPNQSITRAEFVTMLSRLFTLDPITAPRPLFTDIRSSWAKNAIITFANAGIIKGYSDGTFRPNQQITREEIVVILSSLLQLPKLQASGSTSSSDLHQAVQYAQEAITPAADLGSIQGAGNNIVNPQGVATRAEVIQVLFNTLQLLPELSEWLN